MIRVFVLFYSLLNIDRKKRKKKRKGKSIFITYTRKEKISIFSFLVRHIDKVIIIL